MQYPIAPNDSDATNRLLQRVAAGETNCLGDLLVRHRARLTRMVAVRLDLRLAGRLDPSDVVQESQLEATSRIQEFLARPTMPFFLWLRLITGQCVAACHRRHLGAKRRDADREISLDRPLYPQASSVALAAQLLGKLTSPSHAFAREETKARLHMALERMDPMDREVLVLRHLEQLTTAEAAAVLGITVEATKKRHVRSLKRLKMLMDESGGSASHD